MWNPHETYPKASERTRYRELVAVLHGLEKAGIMSELFEPRTSSLWPDEIFAPVNLQADAVQREQLAGTHMWRCKSRPHFEFIIFGSSAVTYVRASSREDS